MWIGGLVVLRVLLGGRAGVLGFGIWISLKLQCRSLRLGSLASDDPGDDLRYIL